MLLGLVLLLNAHCVFFFLLVVSHVSVVGFCSPTRATEGFCMLDCVYQAQSRSYFVQDLMCWRGLPLYDVSTELRCVAFWSLRFRLLSALARRCTVLGCVLHGCGLHVSVCFSVALADGVACICVRAFGQAILARVQVVGDSGAADYFGSQSLFLRPGAPQALLSGDVRLGV